MRSAHQGTVQRWIDIEVLDVIALPHRGERHGHRIKKELLEKARRSRIRDKGLL
jgi:hypothetical protein